MDGLAGCPDRRSLVVPQQRTMSSDCAPGPSEGATELVFRLSKAEAEHLSAGGPATSAVIDKLGLRRQALNQLSSFFAPEASTRLPRRLPRDRLPAPLVKSFRVRGQ